MPTTTPLPDRPECGPEPVRVALRFDCVVVTRLQSQTHSAFALYLISPVTCGNTEYSIDARYFPWMQYNFS